MKPCQKGNTIPVNWRISELPGLCRENRYLKEPDIKEKRQTFPGSVSTERHEVCSKAAKEKRELSLHRKERRSRPVSAGGKSLPGGVAHLRGKAENENPYREKPARLNQHQKSEPAGGRANCAEKEKGFLTYAVNAQRKRRVRPSGKAARTSGWTL